MVAPSFCIIATLFLGVIVSSTLVHEILYSQIYGEDDTEKTILVKLMNTQISSKNKNSIRYSTTQLLQYQDIAMLEPKADLVILPEGSIQRSLGQALISVRFCPIGLHTQVESFELYSEIPQLSGNWIL